MFRHMRPIILLAAFALVALCNRVLSADRVAPGDQDRVGAVLARVAATLDLGVELLGRGSDERATSAVATVPLMVIFSTVQVEQSPL